MGRATTALLVLLAAAFTFAGPTRSAPRAEPAAPDLLFFTEQIAADLHSRCASCHSDPESAGNYLLAPIADLRSPDRATVLKNYRTTLAFLDPEDPGRSPLLKKALGGSGHGGGALYGAASRDYTKLLHFAMGATVGNLPPEAIAQKRYQAVAGLPLEIDGTLSGDPDGNAISFHWQVFEKPAGSRARIEGGGDGAATLTPDKAGVYRLELSVHDGKLWSLPASFLVVASGGGQRPAVDARRPMDGGMGGEPKPATTKKSLTERRLDPKRLRLVRRLYLDLMWRSPRLHEIERWLEVPHEQMVKELLEDEAMWDAWYEQQLFYFLLLDRFRPKEGRLTTVPRRLADGKISAARAVEEIVRSQYFNARNPGNDTFVTVVLEQCLGMVVQERRNIRILELGKKMYDGYKSKLWKESGDSQADFVRIVFRQPDFYRHLLSRTWTVLHGTEIDKKRLKRDAERFRSGLSFRDILVEWLTGPDYVEGALEARTKPEIPYVRGLFVDTLDRMPSYEELRNIRNAFLSLADPTPIRLVMGRMLLESDQGRLPASAIEPERFVKEQFIRLFARQPTGRELTTFSKALKNDPAVTPRVVLWTLISSPEYQTY